MSSKRVFLREATGLVRQIDLFDAIIGNLSWAGPLGAAIAYTSFFTWYALPGADLVTALLAAAPLCAIVLTVIALMAAAMPRAGGDYVYVSRLIHPAIGFMNNFAWVVIQLIYASTFTTWILLDMGYFQVFKVAGILYSNQSVTALGIMLQEPVNKVLVGMAVMVLLGLVAIMGIKTLFRVGNATYILGCIGLAVGLVVLVQMSHADFVLRFNQIMTPFHENAYDYVITTADSLGFGGAQYSVWLTVGALTQGLLFMMYSFPTIYAAGEMKRANKVRQQVLAIVLPVLVNLLIAVSYIYLMIDRIGLDFLTRYLFLSFNHPEANPFPIDYAHVLVALVSPNPIIGLIQVGTLGLFVVPYVLMNFIMATRSFFAYSFDRVFPGIFAEVSDRFHTPVKATVITTIVLAISCALALLTPTFFYIIIAGMIPSSICMIIILLSGTILPYKARGLYKSSPININIGRVPVITILGVAAIAVQVLLVVLIMSFPTLALSVSPDTWLYFAALFVIPLVLFYVIRRIRRNEGVDISLAAKEIPPE